MYDDNVPNLHSSIIIIKGIYTHKSIDKEADNIAASNAEFS